MKTKYIFLALALLIGSFTLTTSCKKYEDGPAFSLRTKKARLSGDWQLSSITFNGNDITGNYGSDYALNIEKDGTYKQSYTIKGLINITSSAEGKWKFGEDKDDVYFTPNSTGVETANRILRLANKELWLKYTASNGDITITKLKQ